ncbi:glycerol kinase [Parabacteroides sp. PF5-9]|uniref:FGGY-family carbohydrate kinase n=1 Tax=Parabacteroides sp. PF5-9 TaxID=1742404 RepID=UPI002475C186|nr:glycerol kinase [Parabacteroides sp. PF5-9]MDH6357934.1 glycerol kinase [Parabacteroides sp. PF5-9]
MEHRIIAIDQSTSATKAMLFSEKCELLRRVNISHQQYYPKAGWVEHDAEEIFRNVLSAIGHLMEKEEANGNITYSLAITNQRETVVVWNKNTGTPVCNAVVWQCARGAAICKELRDNEHTPMVQQKSGLLIDPYFSASGVKWILDHVEGARESAEKGDLLMGTIDTWLIWKLTEGKIHATDYTNASRTLLFNIHTLDWDNELLDLFTIPRSMMAQVLPCDSVFGETTVNGLFDTPIQIAGVLGDSHGALAGQMCFEEGLGKATYGTGSSVMVNIGEQAATAPQGLVTSIGFSALGKVYYAFEGNIHCTGATINWLEKQLDMITHPGEAEILATSIENNGGVYFVPAFTGLGAPWWHSEVKAAIFGMTLGTSKAHIARAALESIAYQVKDLVSAMTQQAGITLKELRADGGPTKNKFLMQFQADLLGVPINCLDIEEASALGAVVMNGLARKVWNCFQDITALRSGDNRMLPATEEGKMELLYKEWQKTVKQLIK